MARPVTPAPPVSSDRPSLTFRLTPDGVFAHAGAEAAAYFGFDADAPEQPKLAHVVARSDQGRVRALWARLRNGADQSTSRLNLYDVQGGGVAYDVTFHAYRDAADALVAVDAVALPMGAASASVEAPPEAPADCVAEDWSDAPMSAPADAEDAPQGSASEVAADDAPPAPRASSRRRLGRGAGALPEWSDLVPELHVNPSQAERDAPRAPVSSERVPLAQPLLDAVTHGVPFPMGLAELDDDGAPRLVYANAAAARVLGCAAPCAQGRALADVLGDVPGAAAMRQAWADAFARTLASGQPERLTLTVNGRFLLGTAAGAPANAGRPRFVFFFTDETEVYRRATALTRRVQELEAAQAAPPVAAGPEEGAAVSEPPDASWAAALRTMMDAYDTLAADAAAGQAEQARLEDETARLAAENAKLHAEATAAAEALRDLQEAHTALEAQAEENEQARASSDQSAHAKSAFLATVSHEIRDPLNGILGMAQVLEGLPDEPLTPAQAECVASIQASGQVLLALVNDILDVSKKEAERIELAHLSFDLHALARGTMALVRPMLHHRATVHLAVDLAPGVAQHVVGDEDRLRQVLLNLLSNAAKFTAHGTIALRLAPSPGGIRFEVTDTGTGIAPDVLPTLFKPYDPAASRRVAGSGYGLTITRGLIELMGGTMDVKSTVGSGTTFRFIVPLLPALDAGPATDDGTAAFRGMHLLLAEDNLVHQKITLRVLERLGVKADVAANGAEAVEAVRQGRLYPVVLMDVQMPVMDGFEATAAIRALPLARQPYIVALTGTTLGAHVRPGRASGMDAFVAKPISVEHLAAVLRAAVARRTQAVPAEPLPA